MDLKSGENPECVGPCSSGITNLGTVTAAPIRKRRFSSAKIQPTRVKRVMQSDDEIGRMVASVPVAVGRAMEHFAEKLLETAAQSVLYSSSRTLTPSHMKQAVVRTPHFMFLEPLMREIPLPPSVGSEVQWRTEWAEQPSFSGFHPPGPSIDPATSCHIGMQIQPSQIAMPKLPAVGGNILSAKRRQSNGEMDGNETKPKRGRPRKVKKEEKCVDEDGLSMDEKPSLIGITDSNRTLNGSLLTDRELMPPPSMLPVRILEATTTIDQKSNQLSAFKMNNINNGEQRQQSFMEQLNCQQSSQTTMPITNDPEEDANAAAAAATMNSETSH